MECHVLTNFQSFSFKMNVEIYAENEAENENFIRKAFCAYQQLLPSALVMFRMRVHCKP